MSAGAGEGRLRAVSVGGGTGQPNTIAALRLLDCRVSAIVSMVDDGGSTGILRRHMGVVPPGDVRKCLVAMAARPDGALARAFQHRFDFAQGHAMGNLLLAALAQETGSFADAVGECARILDCQGDVLPSTLDDVVLCGRTLDGQEFRGQTSLGIGPCALSRVWLDPPAPRAFAPAVEAILDADVVVLGPGSLFTSIVPNLLVPDVLDALRGTRATRVYVFPMADMQGETWGFGVEEYLDALEAHAGGPIVDVALVHRAVPEGQGVATRCFQALTNEQVRADAAAKAADLAPNDSADPDPDWYWRQVEVTDAALRRIGERVPTVVVRDFSNPADPAAHDVAKLSATLQGVFDACRSPRA